MMNEQIAERDTGDEVSFAQFSQAHGEDDGMLKCAAPFFRIELLICWFNLEQQGVFL